MLILGLCARPSTPLTAIAIVTPADIAKLKFVGTARRFDFSIEDCRELLALYEDKDRPSGDVKKIAINKIADIDRQLAELQRLKSDLVALSHA